MSKAGPNRKAQADRKAQERQRANDFLEDVGPVLFVTSRGVEVECLPIAAEIEAQEENIRNSIAWPEIPKRKVTDVAGSVAEFPYTEKTIENAPDEDKERWATYLSAQRETQAEFDRRIAEARPRLLAYRGIRVVDESLFARWETDHRWLGMTVPDDPRERSMHFLRTEILGNPETDLFGILLGIYRASGYSAEIMERAEAFFRRQMGRGIGASAGGDTGDAESAPEAGETGLVAGGGLDGD